MNNPLIASKGSYRGQMSRRKELQMRVFVGIFNYVKDVWTHFDAVDQNFALKWVQKYVCSAFYITSS